MTCTVTSFGQNVYIYKTDLDQTTPEIVCAKDECIQSGSNKYTGTVNGLTITVTIPTLSIQENQSNWTCTQGTSDKYLVLNVYCK